MQLKSTSRRGFLSTSFAGAAGLGLAAREAAAASDEARRHPLKITGVTTYHLRHKLPQAVGGATAFYDERDDLLIKITTDAGLVGWGETAMLTGVRATIDELGRALIGKNPLDHRLLWRGLWGPNFGNGLAVGGLDIALNDLRGKALNLSVADLYGGRLRDRVPAYAAALYYRKDREPKDHYPDDARRMMQLGFRAVKMRLGGLPHARDLAAAAAVREAVGPDVKLMVDGNGAYTFGGAVRMGRELEQLDYHFFEEPLPQPNYAGYDALTAALDIPIAAGEVLGSRGAARDLIARRGMRIIQPDVSLCGGIGECLFIAEMAALWGIPCIPHCWGGALVIAATLQVLSLLPDASWARTTETPMLEFDVSENPFREELVTSPAQLRDGLVDVPAGPGLGVEVDEEVVRRYAV